MSPGFELVRIEAVDSGGDQRLFNGRRQIIWDRMRLREAWRQSPPGDKIGRGVAVMLPEIQKRGESHGLFSFPAQRSKRDRPNSERNPECDSPISKRDDYCLTPGDVQRRKRERHDAFHDADARWGRRNNKE